MKATADTAANDNPYVGPRTFREEDYDRYFGRDAEARELLALVVNERLTVFYAQSGAGKSSLINARLAPWLGREGFTVLPIARVSGVLPPGVDPQTVTNIYVYHLILSLLQEISEEAPVDPAALADTSLSRFLSGETGPDTGKTASAASARGENQDDLIPHVLIIDQFEDLLVTHPERWPERAGFFEQLSIAIAQHPNLWVVLTLREDYIAGLEPYAHLVTNGLRARFYMQRMGIDAALKAIELPAEKKRPFAAGVTSKLVDNLRLVRAVGQPGYHKGPHVEPVQLQVVCYQLWEDLRSRPGETIELADLERLAGGQDLADYVDRALSDFYEQCVAAVLRTPGIDATELFLRRWFSEKLLTEAGTRSAVFRNEDTGETAGLSNRAVDLLSARYLLRTELRAGGAWVELVHDRLVGPVRANNAAWYDKNLSEFQRQAARWEEAGEKEGDLPKGADLAELVLWARAHEEKLSAYESRFLAASESKLTWPSLLAIEWATEGRPDKKLLTAKALVAAEAEVKKDGEGSTELEREFLAASWANLKSLPYQAAWWATQGRPQSSLLRGQDLVQAELWATANEQDLTDLERGYLAACRDHWDRQGALSSRARKWAMQDRAVSLLLSGQELAGAEEWAREHADDLTDVERHFLKESQRAEETAERERRQNTLIRRLARGAILLALVAIIVAAFALIQFFEANEERDKAFVAEQTAEKAATEALQARDTAIAAQKVAEQGATAEAETGRMLRATLQVEQEVQNIAAATEAEATAGWLAAQEAEIEAALQALKTPSPSPFPTATPTATATALSGSAQPPPSPTLPSATPTPTSTPAPMPTPNWAATAAVEALQDQLVQVQARQTVIARCGFEPQGEFNALWNRPGVLERLGCPLQASAASGYFAEQQFDERGYMYWSQNLDRFFVMIYDPRGKGRGRWITYENSEIPRINPSGTSCEPDIDPDPDEAVQIQPVRGFGGVWCHLAPETRATLGYATERERGVNGNLLQAFEQGYILRDSTGMDRLLFADNMTYSAAMVFVPEGSLSIGSPQDDGGYAVEVSEFWLDPYEVTNAEYRKCVEAKRCPHPHRENGSPEDRSSTREGYYTLSTFDRFPVIFVAWHDALLYCGWLGKRLPTEAEWEWAAKGLKNYRYPWGNELPSTSRANYMGKDTTQVGRYDPTALGLYDMAGNVWEWTSSLYWDYPYDPGDGREDSEADGKRVLRGGSWRDGPDSLRTTNRNAGTAPDYPLDNVGFRCAMSSERP